MVRKQVFERVAAMIRIRSATVRYWREEGEFSERVLYKFPGNLWNQTVLVFTMP